MMCHEAKRNLDLFMDGALSVPENMKVLEHLNLCPGCSLIYEGEKTLRVLLREKLGSGHAPAGLPGRLSRALRRPAGSARRPWGSLAAAVFLVTLVASLLFSPAGDTPPLLAATVAVRHDATREGFHGNPRSSCLCVCSECADPADIPGFFRRHVSHDVCTHDLKPMDYEFVGASVWTHRGRQVCWTVQRNKEGRVVSHALVPTSLAAHIQTSFIRAEGRVVILVPQADRGMVCAFIFDDDREAERFRKMSGH